MEEKTNTKQSRVEHIATQMTKTLRDREKTTMAQMTMTEVIDHMGDLKKGLTVTKKVEKTTKNYDQSVHEYGFIEIKEFTNVARIPNDTEGVFKFGPDFTGKVKHNPTAEEVSAASETTTQTTPANQTSTSASTTGKTPGEITGVEYAKDDEGNEIIYPLHQKDIDAVPELAAAGLTAGTRLRLNKEAIDKARKLFFQGAEVVREEVKIPVAPVSEIPVEPKPEQQTTTPETTGPNAETGTGGDGVEKTTETTGAEAKKK